MKIDGRNRPLHVGVFSYYYLPVINGVTLTIADWKRWGEKKGAKLTIFVPHLGIPSQKDVDVVLYPAVPIYKKLGITVPVFPEPHIEKELVRRQGDVLHAHHPFYIGKLALYFKKKLGLPLVFTYHTRYSDYARTYMSWLPQQFVRVLVMKAVVRFINQCDAVTAAHETLKQELITYGVRTPIFIVPPGVDTAKFSHGDRAAARKRFGFGPKDQVLLYVGRLAREKNIYFLLRAYPRIHKKNPKAKLLLVGNGLEENRLRRYARRHGFTREVIIASRETVATMPDVYASADLFIYASQTETYGRVIVEAMAAGLPIVALKGPSIVDLLKDRISGRIVFEQSPRRFAEIVREVLRDSKRAMLLGKQAQREARNYDSKISWELLFGVYQTALESVRGPVGVKP